MLSIGRGNDRRSYSFPSLKKREDKEKREKKIERDRKEKKEREKKKREKEKKREAGEETVESWPVEGEQNPRRCSWNRRGKVFLKFRMGGRMPGDAYKGGNLLLLV